MLKDIIRILGISFILSGIFLYFYASPKNGSNLQVERDALHEQVNLLQTKLEQTEEELARLQLLTSEAAQEKEGTVDEDDGKENSLDDEAPTATFKLTIESGTTSKDVASQLEQANIIEDAKIFNDYLKDRQLTTKIQIGEYDIDASMSTETISTIITTLPENR